MRIILASQSPRRRELLERMGVAEFDIIPAQGEEVMDHMVYTGVTLFSGGRTATEHEATSVRFRPLSQGDIDHYLATGEPMDKAGAYGIQGYGSVLVEGISGDYYNVMGLPVCRLGRMLARFGVDTLSMAAKKEQGT